jgi:putative endonuclease
MGKTQEVGRLGEDAVCAFLLKNGYTILERNFYCKFGEIDIIAQKAEVLALVEVKARRENALVSGLEAVGYTKRKKLLKTAEIYINKTHTQKQIRFDVAQVTVHNSKPVKLEYFVNAFEAE